MRSLNSAISCVIMSLIAACLPRTGIAQTVKDLNESSGLKLLRENTKNYAYKVPIGNLLKLLNRTQKDHSRREGLVGAELLINKLVEGKWVVQKSEMIGFPKISGQYV